MGMEGRSGGWEGGSSERGEDEGGGGVGCGVRVGRWDRSDEVG